MILNVYGAEKFEKGKWRYVILALIMVCVIWVCIYYRNWTWIILMFVLLWWYIYVWINLKEITLQITEEWLVIWEQIVPWGKLTWYVIEIRKDTQEIKNIVLLYEKSHSIYTILDTPDHIKNFLSQLANYLPMTWEYQQTRLEKLARILKL